MGSEDELGEEKERTEVLKRDPRGKLDLYWLFHSWILIYLSSCRFLLTEQHASEYLILDRSMVWFWLPIVYTHEVITGCREMHVASIQI